MEGEIQNWMCRGNPTLGGDDLRVIGVNVWFTVLSPHTCRHHLQQVRREGVQGKVIENC